MYHVINLSPDISHDNSADVVLIAKNMLLLYLTATEQENGHQTADLTEIRKRF